MTYEKPIYYQISTNITAYFKLINPFFLGVTFLLICNLHESSKYSHARSAITSNTLIPYTLYGTLFSSTKYFSHIW